MRLLRAFLIIALCWRSLFGAIAYDNATTGVCESCSTKTVTHTATGSNIYAFVSVGIHPNTVSVSSVTCDGVTVNLIKAEPHSANNRVVEIWGLAGCATGAKNYVVTLSGTANGVAVGVTTFTGVAQSSSLGTANSAEGSSAAPSVVITSGVDELVFDSVMMFDDLETLTVDASQVERFHASSGVYSETAGSTEAGAANVTMSWSNSSADAWVIAGVSMKPAAAVAVTSKRNLLGVGP